MKKNINKPWGSYGPSRTPVKYRVPELCPVQTRGSELSRRFQPAREPSSGSPAPCKSNQNHFIDTSK